MWYIIAGIVIILILIVLCKYVLFEPRVNSVISLIFYIMILGYAMNSQEVKLGFWTIFVCISMVDCIRDIILAKEMYEDIEIRIDKFYMVKSLTSLFLFEYSRSIFLLIVQPFLYFSIFKDIKKKIQCGYPLPYGSNYSNLKIKNYFYTKYISRLEKDGMIISNVKTVENEMQIEQKKLNDLYPEKLTAKIADMIAGDKDMKEMRKRAEGWFRSGEFINHYAYLGVDSFERYPKLIIEAMSERGCFPVSAIKRFEELKELNLLVPIVDKRNNNKNTGWSNYFIIQSLEPLVAEGIFSDNDFNDNDVFDNHAYQYVKSTVSMPSIDADNDPLFALDDD